MSLLEDHLEIVITEDDVDDGWQLKDVAAVMAPYGEQIRRIDAQMTEAINNEAT